MRWHPRAVAPGVTILHTPIARRQHALIRTLRSVLWHVLAARERRADWGMSRHRSCISAAARFASSAAAASAAASGSSLPELGARVGCTAALTASTCTLRTRSASSNARITARPRSAVGCCADNASARRAQSNHEPPPPWAKIVSSSACTTSLTALTRANCSTNVFRASRSWTAFTAVLALSGSWVGAGGSVVVASAPAAAAFPAPAVPPAPVCADLGGPADPPLPVMPMLRERWQHSTASSVAVSGVCSLVDGFHAGCNAGEVRVSVRARPCVQTHKPTAR